MSPFGHGHDLDFFYFWLKNLEQEWVTHWIGNLLADLFDKLDEHKEEYKVIPNKLTVTTAWYGDKSIKKKF